MLSESLRKHVHPSSIPFTSENNPFSAYSLLSFRDHSFLVCDCPAACQTFIFWKRRSVFRFFLLIPSIQILKTFSIAHSCSESSFVLFQNPLPFKQFLQNVFWQNAQNQVLFFPSLKVVPGYPETIEKIPYSNIL